jgi:hypothetical protein
VIPNVVKHASMHSVPVRALGVVVGAYQCAFNKAESRRHSYIISDAVFSNSSQRCIHLSSAAE